MLRGIPLVGETADELAGRLKDAIKQILEPSTVFDALDLKYTGRIDGHDIALLEETFEVAKSFDRPVVVHVVTEKGSGYQPAIEDELEKLHGVAQFRRGHRQGPEERAQADRGRRQGDRGRSRHPSRPDRHLGGDGEHGRPVGDGAEAPRPGLSTPRSPNSMR